MDNKLLQAPAASDIQTPAPPVKNISPKQAMHLAEQHFTNGQLPQAEKLLRQLLQAQPKHALALHLLGLIAHQVDKTELALQLISQAIAIAPDVAQFHSNLGEMYRILKRLDQAVAHGLKAVSLAPRLAEAHCNLGITYYDLKQMDKAEACQKIALDLDSGLVSALSNMGNILRSRNDKEGAIALYRQALALDPQNLGALCNLGNVLIEARRPKEAVKWLLQVIKINPNYTEAHFGLGEALAITHPVAAERHYRRALKLSPGLTVAKDKLGIVLWRMSRIKESIAAFRAALADQPNNVVLHNHLSMALLLDGQFKEGWAEGEHRFLMETYRRASKLPWKKRQWDGDISTRDTVVFVAEPGFGDLFQYIRLVGQIREQGVRVAVQAAESVRALLDSSCCYDIFYAANEDFDEATHTWYPLFSLPHLLGISLDSIVAKVPYLSVGQERIERWKKILPQGRRLIGINWQGNPAHETTLLGGRSIPLQFFSALAALPDVTLVSLQKIHGLEQLETCAFRDKILTFDEATYPSEPAFLETAALIQALDLVVTSDTSIAHLAGALDVPVWVGLQFIPDYRWLLGRNDSPWYPSMKLYRQKAAHDWDSVFNSIKNDLAEKFRR